MLSSGALFSSDISHVQALITSDGGSFLHFDAASSSGVTPSSVRQDGSKVKRGFVPIMPGQIRPAAVWIVYEDCQQMFARPMNLCPVRTSTTWNRFFISQVHRVGHTIFAKAGHLKRSPNISLCNFPLDIFFWHQSLRAVFQKNPWSVLQESWQPVTVRPIQGRRPHITLDIPG